MRNPIVSLAVILALTAGCGSGTVKNAIDTSKPFVEVTLVFNPDIYGKIMFSKLYPSYAVWAVDKKTGEMRTIYATGKAARGKWIMADERPSSLPVWFGARAKEKAEPDRPALDGITSATPSGKMVTHAWQVPDSMLGKRIDVYIEGNISFDYNEHYRKDARKGEKGYSDVNGQPSLVWLASIETGKKNSEAVPDLAGRGHVLGEHGEIEKDMSGITTAKQIFLHMDLKYSAGGKN
jgi:hypothetical protein